MHYLIFHLDPLIRIGAVKDKINLILDIDSTLLHAISDYENKPSVSKIKKLIKEGKAIETILNFNDMIIKYALILRPYLKQFLKSVSKFCEIYIYTHGDEVYLRAVINALDPEEEILS